jgi:hypothetical protein
MRSVSGLRVAALLIEVTYPSAQSIGWESKEFLLGSGLIWERPVPDSQLLELVSIFETPG